MDCSRDYEEPGGDAGVGDDDIGLFGDKQFTQTPGTEDRGKRILRFKVEADDPTGAAADIEFQLASAGNHAVLPAVLDENPVKSRDIALDSPFLHRRN